MLTVSYLLHIGFCELGNVLGAAHYKKGNVEIRHIQEVNTFWLMDGKSSFSIIRKLSSKSDVLELLMQFESGVINSERKKNNNHCKRLMLKKSALWAEIKAHEQEYQRIQKQKDDLDQAQKNISFLVQKKIAKGQEIAEKLLEMEAKALIEAGI